MNTELVVVGSLNMDLVVYASRQPHVGETIFGESFLTNPGGKGANQAVAASRLGANVAMIGKVGNDSFGEALMESLRANTVDTQAILHDPAAKTGIALITINASGDNSIIVIPGSNMLLSAQDIQGFESLISQAELLIMQLEVPLTTVAHAAQLAKRHHVKVLLNPAPAQPLPVELLNLVDILVLNESETAILTGGTFRTGEDLVNQAKRLKTNFAGDLVLTLGENGALWIGEHEMEHFPAFSVRTVDTTAAGDAFIGGLSTALLEKKSIPEAIRWANAAGALTVIKKGAQSSLPDRKQLEDFLELSSLGEPI